MRQGKRAGHHRGLRAGHGFKRVNRELGRASRLLGSNRRMEGDRRNQHPGAYWPTRPASEPTLAQARRDTNRNASTQGTGREHKADRPGWTEAVVATHSTAGQGVDLCPDAWGTKAQGTHDNTRKSAGRQCRAWRQCQGKAGGTLSPKTVCTKLAPIAQESGRKQLHSHGQQQPCRLVVSSTARLMVPSGPLLTNRMREIFTYGSVGGGGSNPAPYPAVDAGRASLFAVRCRWPGATHREC